MGCYVNPRDMTKEEWLVRHGELTSGPCEVTETHVPICLVDNGLFTAAGVAFSTEEAKRFNNPTDPRPKQWFKVSREDVQRVSDLANYKN